LKNRSWGGRFSGIQNEGFQTFSASIDFDSKLALYDIAQNIAYARALARAGLLTSSELDRLERALRGIEKEIRAGKFIFREEDEDIHMNIERRLKEKTGRLGGKIHTGRSRNDQVATDTRMYVKENTKEIIRLLKNLRKAFVSQAEKHIDNFMPAYTHLQAAQPVRIAQWFLAYHEMFARDADRFADVLKRADVLPLGSGALAGNNYGIDRKFLARELGFKSVSRNSIDAVSDRDFALDFCHAVAVMFVHVSRLAEELVIFSSREFSTVILPEEFCTGSSIMPQKRNPDLPELLRGKAGRVNGNLVNLLTLLKGLPLAYNRDMQEDKPPLFDSCEQALASIPLATVMVEKLAFNMPLLEKRIADGFITAVDLADYLVLKGTPFREAHHIVGSVVRECEEREIGFTDLSAEELRKYSELFGEDVFSFVDPEKSPDRKKGIGSTSRKAIQAQILHAKKELK
jgi:argininosuccinate lyase